MPDSLDHAFFIRATKWDDLSAVVAIINAQSQAIRRQDATSADSMREVWESPDVDLEHNTWVVESSHQHVVGYASIIPHSTLTFIYQMGVVHPDYTGQGLGTRLLTAAEARAQQLADAANHGMMVRLAVGLDPADEATLALYQQRGFKLDRHWFRMEINLDQPIPEASFSDKFDIRPLNPDTDARAIYAAEVEAFAEHVGEMSATFETYRQRLMTGNFDPSIWSLVWDGPELAAFAVCQTHRSGLPDLGWVRVLGVRPAWRTQGLGLNLLYRSFQILKERGMKRVGLFVDSQNPTGATRLYERAGMRIVQHQDHYSKILRDGIDPLLSQD